MEDILWIEDIVESTPTLHFFTNFKVGMVGFVNLHKVVARRNAFQPCQVHKMKVNWKVEQKVKG